MLQLRYMPNAKRFISRRGPTMALQSSLAWEGLSCGSNQGVYASDHCFLLIACEPYIFSSIFITHNTTPNSSIQYRPPIYIRQWQQLTQLPPSRPLLSPF